MIISGSFLLAPLFLAQSIGILIIFLHVVFENMVDHVRWTNKAQHVREAVHVINKEGNVHCYIRDDKNDCCVAPKFHHLEGLLGKNPLRNKKEKIVQIHEYGGGS